jgi:hypothetical protein
MTSENKTHAITFRLGTKEYEQLIQTVNNRGARSLSDFTRTAVLSCIVSDHMEQLLRCELESLMTSLDAFDGRVRDLRRQLRQLAIRADSPNS